MFCSNLNNENPNISIDAVVEGSIAIAGFNK